MKVQALALRLRPRLPAEASDLGVRLVQIHARSIWRTWTPVLLAVCVLSAGLTSLGDWVGGLTLFWLKPWLERSLLFVCARAVFGQETRWRDLWQARRTVWGGHLLQTLLWQRLVPWRALSLPVMQLEGQHGAALHARWELILKGHRGSAWGVQAAYAHAEFVLMVGAFALGAWMLPDGATDVSGAGQFWILLGGSGPWGLVVYALAIGLLEPFYVASGLVLYLHRRVALEAWDVEQDFRRLYGA